MTDLRVLWIQVQLISMHVHITGTLPLLCSCLCLECCDLSAAPLHCAAEVQTACRHHVLLQSEAGAPHVMDDSDNVHNTTPLQAGTTGRNSSLRVRLLPSLVLFTHFNLVYLQHAD